MKTLFRGLAIVGAFFCIWFLLAQIDYITFFKIDKAKSATEKSVGDMIWDQIKNTEDIIVNDSITNTLDKLLKPLCKENGIVRDSLKVHIIKKDEVNAFALPDGHLVVYSGLIEALKNEQALIGVLGHEIAHIENDHVMKKLSKEIGFSVLMSITTGNNNGSVIREVMHTLSSTAYDRSLEKEADITSVKYMLKAKVDPKPFADFLYDMSFDKKIESALSWVSSHPESEARAKYVLEYIKGKKLQNKTILSQKEWEDFKEEVADYKK
ncbi:M48 family metallopeptidase [Flavobacterium sp. LS1R49]|uniref:M48 family metallopeptidase n=1 Tax=Flavobacterium shii TaxID=2987687 RepID=A0A9X2YUY9_9FLAO|nr:M48 family metallopeptidase [Flavobacterium shii]MCV9927664.1 M48 family metallopeptidase [Flavobacterium shii]